jgi:hypothetical protein
MFPSAIAVLLSTAVLLEGAALPRPQLTFRPPSLDRLGWLAGEWQMTRGAACIEERWMPPANDMLIGMSRTVQNGRTTSFEFMRIVSRTDGIYFVAQPGGRPPVDFKLAAASESEAVFVNPGHTDHLKRIVYRRSGPAELTARVEGEDDGKAFAVDYVYRASPIRAPGTAATAACP